MPETIVRSRNRGLKDIYVAPVTVNTDATYTAGAPIKLARAISAKIKDKFTTEKLYSDDGVEEVAETYEGTDIEFDVNSLAPQDYAALFENNFLNGYLLKAAGDTAKEIAIGWRSKKLNGKYEFEWYYCGKLERPDRSLDTDADKLKTQTASLKGSFYARQKEDTINGVKKNLYSIVVDEGNLIEANTTALAAVQNWFATVQEYTAPV